MTELLGPEGDRSTAGDCEGCASAFDFWVGRWRAAWGNGASGTNTVSKACEGRVILEQFDGRPGAAFTGMSVSLYVAEERTWRQTWVDSLGNYFALAGSFDRCVMTLLTEAHRLKPDVPRYRMRFFNIREDRFEWTWERRTPEEPVWTLRWHIDYSRIR